MNRNPIMRAMSIRKIFERPYTLILLVILVAMMAPHTYRKDEWTDVYLGTSRQLIAGRGIYSKESAYVYPPFSAILFVPMTHIPDKAAQVIWYGICAGAFVLLLKGAWSLSGGHTVDSIDAPQEEHAIALLGVLCAMQFAFNALSHLSLDLIIAGMLMAGGLAAVGGRWMRTAVWWGIAAAFKGPPLLFAGYLIWRRRWAAAALMVIVAIAANMLPDLVHRPAAGGVWVQRWFWDYIRPLARADIAPGQWFAGVSDNQSIAGDLNRWFLTTVSPTAESVRVSQRSNPIGAGPLRFLVLAVDAAVGLLVALVMRPGAGPSTPSTGSGQAGSGQAGLGQKRVVVELGVVMTLILLLSPMSSRSLFCMLLLPAFCIARAAVYRHDRIAWTSIVLAGMASVLSLNMWFAPTFSHETLWLGFPSLVPMMLLLGCLWLLGTGERARELSAGPQAHA